MNLAELLKLRLWLLMAIPKEFPAKSEAFLDDMDEKDYS